MVDNGVPTLQCEGEESSDVSQVNSKVQWQQAESKATTASTTETGVPVSLDEGEEPIDDYQVNKVQRRVSAAGDLSYHPGIALVAPFAPPRQRQKWGDNQILPRTNWGDLFFDLFYVAAAYNVGNIIVASPTGTGLLYFLGAFVPVVNKWMEKTYYDSRYAVDDDLFHRFFEVAVLLALSTAVLHIRPVEFMSNPAEYDDMFTYSLALTLGSALNMYRYVETYFFGKGQIEVIKQCSTRDIRHGMITFVFYLAATIVSGIPYYSNDGSSDSDYNSNANATEASSYGDGHRSMAAAAEADYSYTTASETTNVPIILCLAAPIALHLVQSFTVLFLFPNDGSHKKFTIPMNVDFMIHR